MDVRFRRKLIEATAGWPDWMTKLTEEGAAQVDEACRVANDSWDSAMDGWSESYDLTVRALQLFNDLTGCFGVESIAPQELPDKNRRDWNYDYVDYVNTGETYRATLMFDYSRPEFIVGDWGTYCFETLEEEARDEGILEEDEEDEYA